MGFSPLFVAHLTRYALQNKFRGIDRFPVVLLLKPTLRTNTPGGVLQEPASMVGGDMPVGECLAAADECGAPVINVRGGEPLLHNGIADIIAGLLDGQRFVYLHTNGLIAREFLGRFKPSPFFGWVFHLNGMAETHDRLAAQVGLFESVILAIQAAKRSGFHAFTCTTVYKGVKSSELIVLFDLLLRLKIDGLLLAPACECQQVGSELCPSREETVTVFQTLHEKRGRYPFHGAPSYLEFLAGRRELPCLPWSTPVRDVSGWKPACERMVKVPLSSFRALMEETDWARYGRGRDAGCGSCLSECGFDAGTLESGGRAVNGLWTAIRRNWFGA